MGGNGAWSSITGSNKLISRNACSIYFVRASGMLYKKPGVGASQRVAWLTPSLIRGTSHPPCSARWKRTGCKPAEPCLALAARGRGLDSSERVAAYPLDAYPLEVHLNSRLDIRVVRARGPARLVRVRVQVRVRAELGSGLGLGLGLGFGFGLGYGQATLKPSVSTRMLTLP